MLLCISLVDSVTTIQGEREGCCGTVSTGYHQPPLYLRVCCVNSNLGQTVRMRENNSSKVILCPLVRPRSCPTGNKLNLTRSIKIILNYKTSL